MAGESVNQRLREALRISTEHNALYFGEKHNTVIGGRAALASADQQGVQVPQCRSDGRCQYAIDHGAEGLGHCPAGKCAYAASPQQPTVKESLTPAAERAEVSDIAAMVNRFLTWPVPAEVHPDGTPGQPGRTGTNLLNAQQARVMLEHVLAVPPSERTEPNVKTAQALEALDSLEAAARGDEPFPHFAAALIRAALSTTPVAQEQREDAQPVAWIAPSRGYNTVGYHSDKVNELPIGTKLYPGHPPTTPPAQAQAQAGRDADRYECIGWIGGKYSTEIITNAAPGSVPVFIRHDAARGERG